MNANPVWLALLALAVAAPAGASLVCPDSSSVTVEFSCTYTENYENGQPYDYVTISPLGTGDTFASNGIFIQVCLRDCDGNPVVGLDAKKIVLFNEDLCVCAGGNVADAPTDDDGCTTFSGTIRGAKHATSLTVVADGVEIDTIPVKVNSGVPSFDERCEVGSHSLSVFSTHFRAESGDKNYSIQFDLNEDGINDVVDLVQLSWMLGENCFGPPPKPAPAKRQVHAERPPRGAPVAEASPPEIGIFFDPEGISNCAEIPPGELVPFLVLAKLDGSKLDGISGGEFRLAGIPLGVLWTFLETDVNVQLAGSPIYTTHFGRAGCSGPGRLIELGSGQLFTREPLEPTVISIEAATPPSNRLFACPLLTSCQLGSTCVSPASTPPRVCATGLEAYLNPVDPGQCTVGAKKRTWGQVKTLFR